VRCYGRGHGPNYVPKVTIYPPETPLTLYLNGAGPNGILTTPAASTNASQNTSNLPRSMTNIEPTTLLPRFKMNIVHLGVVPNDPQLRVRGACCIARYQPPRPRLCIQRIRDEGRQFFVRRENEAQSMLVSRQTSPSSRTCNASRVACYSVNKHIFSCSDGN
jgi:hypothetical protein